MNLAYEARNLFTHVRMTRIHEHTHTHTYKRTYQSKHTLYTNILEATLDFSYALSNDKYLGANLN